MAKALTDRAIRAIKPQVRRAEIPDGGLPGLYLLVQPTGAKGWAYRYRSPVDGKARKLTIGQYPAFGLSDARKGAGAAARTISEGRDPGTEKTISRKSAADRSDIVAALLDLFVKRHIKTNLKSSTASENERLIERQVRPLWGERKVATITRRDVISLLDDIVERGHGTTANRVLALVRKFFNWLVERGVLAASPAAGVKAPVVEVSRDRVLTDQEIRWLWLATEKKSGFSCLARLLLLTGQRRGELAGMDESELDLDLGLWFIPAARTKNGNAHSVPLAPVSVSLIAESPRISDCALVFSYGGSKPISGWSKFKAGLDVKMLEVARREATAAGANTDSIALPSWRLHDLRRTAASGMARLGHPVHVVEALLNHKSGALSGVAAVYNRYSYAEEKMRAAIAWADHVEWLVNQKTANFAQT